MINNTATFLGLILSDKLFLKEKNLRVLIHRLKNRLSVQSDQQQKQVVIGAAVELLLHLTRLVGGLGLGKTNSKPLLLHS